MPADEPHPIAGHHGESVVETGPDAERRLLAASMVAASARPGWIQDCAARLNRTSHAVLHSLVEQASPDMAERLHAALRPRATRTFVGQPGHLRQPWGPGWALVGDAGSWKDPISAHGLTDALRDADLLGRAIIATSLDEQRDEDAYGTYERTRNRLTVPILTTADEIASFHWNDDRIAELLLELNAAMNDELDVITGNTATTGRAITAASPPCPPELAGSPRLLAAEHSEPGSVGLAQVSAVLRGRC